MLTLLGWFCFINSQSLLFILGMYGEVNLLLISKPVDQEEPHLESNVETPVHRLVVSDHDSYYFIRNTSK